MPASVRKAALVLDLFSVERPDWGPTEVADELRIAKSTAHALLAELASVGLIERLPCGRYRLGWRTVHTNPTRPRGSSQAEPLRARRVGVVGFVPEVRATPACSALRVPRFLPARSWDAGVPLRDP